MTGRATAPLPREQFPVADRYRYLDHATVAAPPTVVAHALARDASAATMLGSAGHRQRDERVEEVRVTSAGLLGVPVDDVSFVRNTTAGLALVANGLQWAAGDRVLIADRDHPLTVGAWCGLAELGVSVQTVAGDGEDWAIPVEAFADALEAGGGRVRAVVVSWVNFARGWRHDLAALAQVAHAHGAILVVDVIQGLGVIPCNLSEWGVDAAVAGSQKWLLGPGGVALLATTADLRQQLRVLEPGENSMTETDHRYSFDPTQDVSGRLFEGGSWNRGALAGLGAATDLVAGVGVDTIWAHVDEWCDRLVDGLTLLGATVVSDRSTAGRSAIVTATFDGADPEDLVGRLVSRGVLTAPRGGGIRFSPHAWNDDDDLDATLHAVSRAWAP